MMDSICPHLTSMKDPYTCSSVLKRHQNAFAQLDVTVKFTVEILTGPILNTLIIVTMVLSIKE